MFEKLEKLNLVKYNFDVKDKIFLYIFIFLIGSIVGFIYEEFFYFIFENTLEKRGFLYGPYLPVYGFGVVLMVVFLKRFKKNPLVVFLLAMIVTGVLEYFTGYILWELYHKMWWTYEGLFLNIGNYVCLRSVLTFAVGGIFLIYVIEPLVCLFVSKMSKSRMLTCSLVIVSLFVFDFVLTLLFRNTL